MFITFFSENYQYVATTDKSLWYHGTLGRREAETLIRQFSTKNGTFLVRFSDRNKEDVLTLIHENCVYNYMIRRQVSVIKFILLLLEIFWKLF